MAEPLSSSSMEPQAPNGTPKHLVNLAIRILCKLCPRDISRREFLKEVAESIVSLLGELQEEDCLFESVPSSSFADFLLLQTDFREADDDENHSADRDDPKRRRIEAVDVGEASSIKTFDMIPPEVIVTHVLSYIEKELQPESYSLRGFWGYFRADPLRHPWFLYRSLLVKSIHTLRKKVTLKWSQIVSLDLDPAVGTHPRTPSLERFCVPSCSYQSRVRENFPFSPSCKLTCAVTSLAVIEWFKGKSLHLLSTLDNGLASHSESPFDGSSLEDLSVVDPLTLKKFRNISSLTSLQIRGHRYGRIVLTISPISGGPFPNLVSLSLQNVTNRLMDPTFQHYKFPSLRKLDLVECGLSETKLGLYLFNFRKLESLSLNKASSPVVDYFLRRGRNLTRLNLVRTWYSKCRGGWKLPKLTTLVICNDSYPSEKKLFPLSLLKKRPRRRQLVDVRLETANEVYLSTFFKGFHRLLSGVSFLEVKCAKRSDGLVEYRRLSHFRHLRKLVAVRAPWLVQQILCDENLRNLSTLDLTASFSRNEALENCPFIRRLSGLQARAGAVKTISMIDYVVSVLSKRLTSYLSRVKDGANVKELSVLFRDPKGGPSKAGCFRHLPLNRCWTRLEPKMEPRPMRWMYDCDLLWMLRKFHQAIRSGGE